MTPARQQLLAAAAAAGYTVTTDRRGHTQIIKRVGRWRKPYGLAIYADGTAVRLDCDFGVAAGIRDYHTMRVILGI
jgi:hypothetical protein